MVNPNLLLAFTSKVLVSNYSCLLRTIPIWLLYRYSKVNTALNLIFSIPALLLLVHSFKCSHRLGIKVLFGSALLTVLTFGLLFLVFGYFTKKKVMVRPSFTNLNWLFLKHITNPVMKKKSKQFTIHLQCRY
jgi:hypothetical protein